MASPSRASSASRGLAERLPRQLRLKELRVFVAVLEHRSFRKAAGALHVTQPAVTKAIAGLESLLGVRLFDRSAQGVAPTVHGESFAAHATAVFDSLRSAARDLDRVSRGRTGVLRVGTTPMPSISLLPGALGALMRARPGISINIAEGTEQELIDRLRRGELDAVFVRSMRMPSAEDLRLQRLYSSVLCVYAGREHPLASRPVVTWAEVCRHPFVMSSPEAPFSRALAREMEAAGLPMPEHVVVSSSVNLQYAMVLHGGLLSFGLRPQETVPESRNFLTRLPVALPEVGASITAVTMRRRAVPPLVEQLIALMLERGAAGA